LASEKYQAGFAIGLQRGGEDDLKCLDRQALLADLRKVVEELEDDLRQRCDSVAEIDEKLRSEWQSARDSKRTADAYPAWRDAFLTQVAVAWVRTANASIASALSGSPCAATNERMAGE